MCKCLHKHAVYMNKDIIYVYTLYGVYIHIVNTHTLCVHKYTMNTNHELVQSLEQANPASKESHPHLFIYFQIKFI